MRECCIPLSIRRAWIALAVSVTCLGTGTAQADTRYSLRQIVKLGDTVAGIIIRTQNGFFSVAGLTDRGRITFTTSVAEYPPPGVALIQYADGTFTPIAVAGRAGPVGEWPEDFALNEAASVNQKGNLTFAASAWNDGNPLDLGTFRWDAGTGKVTVVAREGMPAGNDLDFDRGGSWAPVINNRDEIVFPAVVAGGVGVFFAGSDARIIPVAAPGTTLPDGRELSEADGPHFNDAGAITFRAYLSDDPDDGRNHAFLWEKGTFTQLVAARADAPSGGKFALVRQAWVNNANRSVLIVARINDPGSGTPGLYRWTDGTLTAVAVRGQEMPGGGQLRAVTLNQYGVIAPNSRGEHAFMSTLSDGATAAYRMDADGKLSLILKQGAATELGQITRIGKPSFTSGLGQGGYGVGLNSQGQVALPVQIDGGPDTIVLLTPVAP